MKISFFDDEPEIYPIQYGGKARTITNLAREFIKLHEVEEVTILSKSIFSDKEEFVKDNIRYVVLNDENIIKKIAEEINRVDILNIHCCSFTFPNIQGKAKKMYFLHDVLVTTADRGSHLDKSLGGNFDAIIAPSNFAKSVYDKYKKIINGNTECFTIPRNINTNLFYEPSSEELNNVITRFPKLKEIKNDFDYILFFPNRPIEEKGKKYLIELAQELKKNMKKYCIIGPFSGERELPNNMIDVGWIASSNLKYYYSISDVTINFSELPESFSQVCIESSYCGTPVVAFKSGNIPYLAKDIENICIVDKNLQSILQGINKSIEMKKMVGLKDKVKLDIEDKYSTQKVIKSYMNLYKKYMEEK